MNVPGWLLDLERKAAGVLKGKVEGWPKGDFACPWLRRYFSEHHEPRPKVVFVLQDWGVDEGESLAEAISSLKGNGGDRTIRAIAGNPQLKPALANGRACVLNAVWGLRKKGTKKTAVLKTEIHRAAFPIWAAALKELSPSVVCLCGSWAKWPKTPWGEFVNGDLEIERWGSAVALLNRGNLTPSDFRQLKFCTMRLPRFSGHAG